MINVNEIVIPQSKYLTKKLSNTDEWRTSALHFQEFGKYTNHQPNPAPNSQWTKFWKEEHRRCIEGYNCGWDFIPGYFYHYLNYSPIWRLVYKEGTKRASRVYAAPDVYDGDYEYFHYLEEAENSGEHALVFKTRGSGYSYKSASMLNRNYFHIPGSTSLALAHEKEYLLGDGLLTKTWDNLHFINEFTAFRKLSQVKNTDMHKRASYLDKTSEGQLIEKGFKSEIMGVSLKDNPEKARGKRAKLILYEEAGKFPHLDRAWEVNRPSVESGDFTFGLMLGFGTGGTAGEGARSLENMFYKPKAFKIHAVTNIWDKNATSTQCGWFVPAWKNREGCYDKDGNTDAIKAITQVIAERDKEKAAGKPEQLVLQRCAELPLIPAEAVMRVIGQFFPAQILKEQKSEIVVNKGKYLDSNYIGKFKRDADTGEPVFQSSDIEPVREYPISTKRPGVIEIFQVPQKNSRGLIPHGTYIGGIDPLDDDYSSTDSMFSVHIFNRYTRKIVAEYVTRDEDIKHTYEQCRLLLKYYNAVALYENDKKGIYTHFEKMHSLHLLADTPHQLKDSEWRPGTNKSKGVSAIRGKSQGRNALKSFLREPIDIHGEILAYQRIYSLGLLDEMIQWDGEHNTDRVDSMSYCMLLDDTLYRAEKTLTDQVKKELDDPYWNRFTGKQFKKEYQYITEENDDLNTQENV